MLIPNEDRVVYPAVYLILVQNGKILLQLRDKSVFEGGMYNLPAGHKEVGEYPTETIVRETKEEIGIDIQEKDLKYVHTMLKIRNVDSERLDIFFTTDKYTGTIKNMEPNLCTKLEWFDPNSLPENIVQYTKHAIECWQKGISYSEFNK